MQYRFIMVDNWALQYQVTCSPYCRPMSILNTLTAAIGKWLWAFQGQQTQPIFNIALLGFSDQQIPLNLVHIFIDENKLIQNWGVSEMTALIWMGTFSKHCSLSHTNNSNDSISVFGLYAANEVLLFDPRRQFYLCSKIQLKPMTHLQFLWSDFIGRAR